MSSRDPGARVPPIIQNGYLIKRAGTEDRDGWSMMSVQIVHAEKWLEDSMVELLKMYRSLVTLSKARGIEHGVLPWHIVVARKAQEGLSSLMYYDPT